MTHATSSTDLVAALSREDLEAHWMPFTPNREFKQNPRMIVRAEGCHYTTTDGRRVFDSLSGLWCCGLGHGRTEISQAVARQIHYSRRHRLPWGVSESGYYRFDAQQNYQYRAFGVPGLGLKRGLAEDLVIAPYASALALMVSPEHACVNLQRLASEGLAGEFGFYEADGYTASRLPRGRSSAVIRSLSKFTLVIVANSASATKRP